MSVLHSIIRNVCSRILRKCISMSIFHWYRKYPLRLLQQCKGICFTSYPYVMKYQNAKLFGVLEYCGLGLWSTMFFWFAVQTIFIRSDIGWTFFLYCLVSNLAQVREMPQICLSLDRVLRRSEPSTKIALPRSTSWSKERMSTLCQTWLGFR